MTFEETLEMVAKERGFKSFEDSKNYSGEIDMALVIMKSAAEYHSAYHIKKEVDARVIEAYNQALEDVRAKAKEQDWYYSDLTIDELKK